MVSGVVLCAMRSAPALDDAVVVEALLCSTGCAFKRAVVPPSSPANAAARARVCAELFFILEDLSWLGHALCALDVVTASAPDALARVEDLGLRDRTT